LFRGVASRTAQSNYKRLIQVLVIGSDGDHCPQATYDAAKEVGAQIAARSAITVTGGLGGVMEAAGRGAKEKGGMVVGIIPNEDMSYRVRPELHHRVRSRRGHSRGRWGWNFHRGVCGISEREAYRGVDRERRDRGQDRGHFP